MSIEKIKKIQTENEKKKEDKKRAIVEITAICDLIKILEKDKKITKEKRAEMCADAYEIVGKFNLWKEMENEVYFLDGDKSAQ